MPLMKRVHSGPESDLSWFSSEEEGGMKEQTVAAGLTTGANLN